MSTFHTEQNTGWPENFAKKRAESQYEGSVIFVIRDNGHLLQWTTRRTYHTSICIYVYCIITVSDCSAASVVAAGHRGTGRILPPPSPSSASRAAAAPACADTQDTLGTYTHYTGLYLCIILTS